jgi:hypothetical protein
VRCREQGEEENHRTDDSAQGGLQFVAQRRFREHVVVGREARGNVMKDLSTFD